ncbi:MAG TPA: hypothetical protein VII11_00795 [Bacteroidota bacterium]
MAKPTVTLKFNHPVSGATSTTIAVNAVRAVSEPDEFELFPGIQHHYLDGVVEEQTKGFRRVITVDFGVIQNPAQRMYLLYFLLDSARAIDYDDGAGNEELDIAVALDNPSGYANEWLDDVQFGKRYVLRLRERSVRQQFPAPWE